MIALYNGESHKILLMIYKGVFNTLEDFSRAAVKVFLVTGNDKIPVMHELKDGKLYATVPAGIEPSVCAIQVVWAKNEHALKVLHVCSRTYNMALEQEAFVLTEYADEATNLASGQVICIKMHVATYGYDGLNSYELAILRGDFSGSEKEWLQHQRTVSVLEGKGDSETDTMSQKAITDAINAEASKRESQETFTALHFKVLETAMANFNNSINDLKDSLERNYDSHGEIVQDVNQKYWELKNAIDNLSGEIDTTEILQKLESVKEFLDGLKDEESITGRLTQIEGGLAEASGNASRANAKLMMINPEARVLMADTYAVGTGRSIVKDEEGIAINAEKVKMGGSLQTPQLAMPIPDEETEDGIVGYTEGEDGDILMKKDGYPVWQKDTDKEELKTKMAETTQKVEQLTQISGGLENKMNVLYNNAFTEFEKVATATMLSIMKRTPGDRQWRKAVDITSATNKAAGLMSAADKAKLDAIDVDNRILKLFSTGLDITIASNGVTIGAPVLKGMKAKIYVIGFTEPLPEDFP